MTAVTLARILFFGLPPPTAMKSTFVTRAPGLALLLLALSACHANAKVAASTTPGPSLATTESPPPALATGRLPDTVQPQRYRLNLSIDPREERYSGSVTIDVDVQKSTEFMVLHAREMNISQASAAAAGGAIGASTSMRRAAGAIADDELVIHFEKPLPVGKTAVTIQFDAPFSEKLQGLFRVKEGGRWYAFSHFEPVSARLAFPCFDEPAFKVPFEVSIVVPDGMIAVSNTVETNRVQKDHQTSFHFAATPPLPSYLVSFAVGDFEIRQGAASPVPIRLISVRGKGALGERALTETQTIVTALGDYFAFPYPYTKLDLVAVPNFGPGAMENAGLIMFREEALLIDPATASEQNRYRQSAVIAHELAHQWFGDLVTLQWWDDIWLNEGFANWMESKVIDKIHPEYGSRLGNVASMHEVMNIDGLVSARAVRQNVTTTSEAMEAFDSVTYEKGGAILSMLEHWLGAATFQAGVREYIRTYAWKNASYKSLFASLGHASNRDVQSVAETFLNQSGVPTVRVSTTCEKGRLTAFDFSQTPSQPLGSHANEHRTWNIPVCVRVSGEAAPRCFSLDSQKLHAAVAPTVACPTSVFPNAQGANYYRFELNESEALALAKAASTLSIEERISFLSNTWAQVRRGTLSVGVMMRILPAFDLDNNRHILSEKIGILRDIDESLIDAPARPAFRSYAAARLLPAWRELRTASNLNTDRQLLRRSLIGALVDIAGDKSAIRDVNTYADAWLRGTPKTDADTTQAAVELASRHAGRERLQALRAVAKQATIPQDRVTALRAMAGFSNPAILREALEDTLTPDVKVQDARYVFGAAMANRAARPVVSQWVRERFEPLRKKFKDAGARRLIDVASAACTQKERDEAEAFFAPFVGEIEGTKRPFAEALEQADQCIALRQYGMASATDYLKKGLKNSREPAPTEPADSARAKKRPAR